MITKMQKNYQNISLIHRISENKATKGIGLNKNQQNVNLLNKADHDLTNFHQTVFPLLLLP